LNYSEKHPPAEALQRIPLLAAMQQSNDARIIEIDDDGTARFNASFINVNYLIINISYLIAPLDQLTSEYDSLKNTSSEDMKALYEKVFRQEEFTGRSGSMFGFEGLGCIWWHMVAYGGIWWPSYYSPCRKTISMPWTSKPKM
jgi:hypothetical protein